MILKKTYVEYLLSTPINYTCSNLSAHLEGVSHDVVSDFLANARFTPRDLWHLVKKEINFKSDGFLIVDDSVQDKRYSKFIELVKRQYSGNEHSLLRGIGLVNMVYSEGEGAIFIRLIIGYMRQCKTKRLKMSISKRCFGALVMINPCLVGLSCLIAGMARLPILNWYIGRLGHFSPP